MFDKDFMNARFVSFIKFYFLLALKTNLLESMIEDVMGIRVLKGELVPFLDTNR